LNQLVFGARYSAAPHHATALFLTIAQLPAILLLWSYLSRLQQLLLATNLPFSPIEMVCFGDRCSLAILGILESSAHADIPKFLLYCIL